MKKLPTLSTLFWLNSNGKMANNPTVYCRLTVDGMRSEISLQRTIPKDQWGKGAVIGKSPEAKALDTFIAILK